MATLAINIHRLNISNKLCSTTQLFVRTFSIGNRNQDKEKYKLVIVGGGCGGISCASKFRRHLKSDDTIAIIEPSEYHYYQPGWTLVGGGLKTVEELSRKEKALIPKGCDWIRAKAVGFDPEKNSVHLSDNRKIEYDYLIVAVGIETNFDGVKGLKEALKEDDNVVTNYSPIYVKKTFPAIQRFKGGNAIFTFPNSVIKCPGAPQKIIYIADDCFRKNGVRDKATVIFNTSLPFIFGVKKYAERLMKVVEKKGIQLNTRTELVEIDHTKHEAKFRKLDAPETYETYNYALLHVAPPMKPFDFVRQSPISDLNGFVDVNKETLQHKKYPNIFALGDCSNIPTSKTAAAIAVQNYVLFENLRKQMNGQSPIAMYDGYTSCPLITGYGKTIMAEFDFNGNPLETFPFDQGKERRSMYHLKKDLMPELYWYGLLKGRWNGPTFYRKLMHFGRSQ